VDLRHDVLSGTIADRYQIRSVAGRGGMAIVYLAWDLRHDRAVALKLLRPEQGPSVGKARFLREIQIAAHLSHPNILAVLDSGLIDFPDGESLPFYVMPFVEDRNLAERLADPTPLPVDDALRIAAEVASALQHAHRHGIVHRDIKPANILLQDGHALVTDFGVAREFEASSITLTSAGMAIGTVQYMSPEQLSADPKLDGRADIYALGCVLFEMLAGRPPYGGASPQETCAGHMSGIVPDMRRHVPDISPEIQAVVEQAMAKNPANRFATAADFRQALVRLQHLRGSAVLRTRLTAACSHSRTPSPKL
jgi:serine/threonine-protein kinase